MCVLGDERLQYVPGKADDENGLLPIMAWEGKVWFWEFSVSDSIESSTNRLRLKARGCCCITSSEADASMLKEGSANAPGEPG